MKARIIERTNVDGRTNYVIQQRHFLFRFWVDAWINSVDGASCRDSFSSLEEAKNNLCYFDGSKVKERVVYSEEGEISQEAKDRAAHTVVYGAEREEKKEECPHYEKTGTCIAGCGTDTCIHHPNNR